MDPYNTLYTDFFCHQCHQTVGMEIQLHFGDTNQYDYQIGDRYRWLPTETFLNGGRPADGNMDGQVEETCPLCGKTYTVMVEIRNDIITRIIHSYGTDLEGDLPLSNNQTLPPERQPGKIEYGKQWQLNPGQEAALSRLAELGVDIYSLGGDEFTLMIPLGLREDQYIDVGYLLAQLGNEVFPAGYEGLACKEPPSKVYPKRISGHPPVHFVDGYPGGLKYRVQLFTEDPE